MKKILFLLCVFACLLTGCSSKEDELFVRYETFQESQNNETIISPDVSETKAENPASNELTSTCQSEQVQTKCIEGNFEPSEKEAPKVATPGTDILLLPKETEMILVSQDNNAFAEMKIKDLSRGEITFAMNFFKPEKRATVVLYGNWIGNTFDITSYLGKEEIDIIDVSLSSDRRQVILVERRESEDVKWLFTQVENEEVANAIHNGEMKFPY